MLSKFGMSVVHLLRPRDYEKLLAQVMRPQGGWLAPYCDPAGNLIIAADHQGARINT
jgi:hypothetical protein